MTARPDAPGMPRGGPAASRSQAIRAELFASPRHSVYAILDGAANPDLVGVLRRSGAPHACLFAGKLDPSEVQTAPYVVELDREHAITSWLLEEGWGRSWGIFATSAAELRAVRKHLKTFLLVRDPDGRRLYFRYYDPRVFRVYLPTCNAQETGLVFGPVLSYAMEDESGENLLVFEPGPEGPRRRSVAL